mgnify:CR=1 FL=1
MKISKELLQKYASGTCTEEEHEFIEKWLNSGGSFSETGYERLFEPRKEIVRQQLHRRLWHNYNTMGRNTKRVIRLSAAACMLFGAFLGGRVSANSKAPVALESPRFEEHLYIKGVKDVQGDLNLPGDYFRVRFDGTLRLYNASKKVQVVQSGDSLFTLEPNRAYYLSGNTKRAELNYTLTPAPGDVGKFDQSETALGFSILRLNR